MHSARYTLTAAVLYLVGTLAMTSSSAFLMSWMSRGVNCGITSPIHAGGRNISSKAAAKVMLAKKPRSTHDFSAPSLPDHLSFTVTVSKRRQCEHSNVRLSYPGFSSGSIHASRMEEQHSGHRRSPIRETGGKSISDRNIRASLSKGRRRPLFENFSLRALLYGCT